MTTHQTHDKKIPGQTDSFRKLERLKIPENLSGKMVLDIGCNEGFFTNQSACRGAASVIGLDFDENFIAVARKMYGSQSNIQFIAQGWNALPIGPFDLILWSSAMHYETDPLSVLTTIHKSLSDDGTFILEAGVLLNVIGKEMVYVTRHDNGHWYPSWEYMEDIFYRAGFTYRVVSQPELVGSDPVPRTVFHCKKRKTEVIIISGESGIGKSNISQVLKQSASKLIKLDSFITRIAVSKTHTEFEKYIAKNINRENLKEIIDGIDLNGFTESYVSMLEKTIAITDILVIIEGYITTKQIAMLTKVASKKYYCWLMRRE